MRDAECVGSTPWGVIDSSVYPIITHGGLKAPAIMVGGNTAGTVPGRDPLPSNADHWQDPDGRYPAAANPL
jgi:hypothetical protein